MTNIFQAKNLSKKYGSRLVSKDLSVKIVSGSIVAILGPNGSGKTTLFKMLAGLLTPDKGQVYFNKHIITNLNLYERSKLGIAYLPQESSVFRGMSVEDNLKSILEIYYLSRDLVSQELEILLKKFKLMHIRHNKALEISGGQKRRLEIARSLISKPKCVFFDEPFAGIDPVAVGDIIQIITELKDSGMAVFITDHNVRETLKTIDYGYILHDGNIIMQGTAKDIVTHSQTREVYLGKDFIL